MLTKPMIILRSSAKALGLRWYSTVSKREKSVFMTNNRNLLQFLFGENIFAKQPFLKKSP